MAKSDIPASHPTPHPTRFLQDSNKLNYIKFEAGLLGLKYWIISSFDSFFNLHPQTWPSVGLSREGA